MAQKQPASPSLSAAYSKSQGKCILYHLLRMWWRCDRTVESALSKGPWDRVKQSYAWC